MMKLLALALAMATQSASAAQSLPAWAQDALNNAVEEGSLLQFKSLEEKLLDSSGPMDASLVRQRMLTEMSYSYSYSFGDFSFSFSMAYMDCSPYMAEVNTCIEENSCQDYSYYYDERLDDDDDDDFEPATCSEYQMSDQRAQTCSNAGMIMVDGEGDACCGDETQAYMGCLLTNFASNYLGELCEVPCDSSPTMAPTLGEGITSEFTVSGISLADAVANAGVFTTAIADKAGVDEDDVDVSFSEETRRKLLAADQRQLAAGDIIVTYIIYVANAAAAADIEAIMGAVTTAQMDAAISAAATAAGATATFAAVATESISTTFTTFSATAMPTTRTADSATSNALGKLGLAALLAAPFALL